MFEQRTTQLLSEVIQEMTRTQCDMLAKRMFEKWQFEEERAFALKLCNLAKVYVKQYDKKSKDLFN